MTRRGEFAILDFRLWIDIKSKIQTPKIAILRPYHLFKDGIVAEVSGGMTVAAPDWVAGGRATSGADGAMDWIEGLVVGCVVEG